MALFLGSNEIRPNRLNEKKDENYHARFARWCLNSMNDYSYQSFITKTLVNWSFFKGGDGQWIFDEDLESFFLDESGDVRNRLKMVENIIKPMVLQYVGNAVRMNYTAKAVATSDFAINKRDKELARVKFFEKIAQRMPELDSLIRDRVPLGANEIETEEIFENSWIDDYEDDINNLLKYVSNEIDMDELKVRITKHLAISGMGIYKGYEQNGRYLADDIDPLFFIRDLSAKKPDLSDSEYMGEWYFMDIPTLFEKFQNISVRNRLLLERYSQQNPLNGTRRVVNNFYNNTGSKVPVYEIYWKDVEEQEYGWIKDEYGYPFFTRINHEDSEYKTKDLIKPPTDAHKDVLKGGKKSAKIYVDVLRYCIFVPREEVGTESDDVVLESGVVPYQEKYAFDPSNVDFPYKVYTWSYDKGEVMSPIDDAINPQRFINRLKSIAESQINNARGSGSVIAKDAVDPRDGEENVVRSMNKSKPIFVDTTRTGSVQNTIGQYGGGIDQGVMGIFGIIRETHASIQNTTGINEAMTGTSGGGDALVGVLQSQIDRGSLVQEPFYWALTSILKQASQHIVSVGKRIYADNPRRLAISVGDKGMQNIIITKDTKLEEHKIFLKRSESEAEATQAANALLFTLLQGGLIDSYAFSHLFNRSDADSIAKHLRGFQKEKLQAQRELDQINMQRSQQQQQQMAQVAEASAAEKQAMMDREDMSKQIDRELDYNKTLIKEGAKNEREKIKKETTGML